MEFVVDGQRLGRVLGPYLGLEDATEQYVSVLVGDWPTSGTLDDLGRLFGGDPEPSLGGRTAMYICAECGDLGCGSVTAVVDVQSERIVWRDFGYQTDYEPFDQDSVFSGVGPFAFDRRAYALVLDAFRVSIDDEPPLTD